MDEPSQAISVRVDSELYEKILERQREAKRLTGIEPTVSAVMRAMLEEAASSSHKRKR